jgi:hypothetical protein
VVDFRRKWSTEDMEDRTIVKEWALYSLRLTAKVAQVSFSSTKKHLLNNKWVRGDENVETERLGSGQLTLSMMARDAQMSFGGTS